MMQVPVPQHLGSLFMQLSVLSDLAIGTTMVCNLSVSKTHVWTSEGAVLGHSPFHPLAP